MKRRSVDARQKASQKEYIVSHSLIPFFPSFLPSSMHFLLVQAYYDEMATLIQKTYRGRLSRRHKHDFYARQRYVTQVAATT
jgi:hypothetical protein